MIYVVMNFCAQTHDCVVPDQDTLLAAESHPGLGRCFIGDEQTAQELLAQNKAAFLTQEAGRFTAYKESPPGSNINFAVDLAMDSDECADVYFVFNPLTGLHETATGCQAARALQEDIKQRFLQSCAMTYHVLESLPPLPAVEGVQEL